MESNSLYIYIYIFIRISFLGHSLGGLIIRAALPHLEEYENKMYTFMTLSSPHLGYVYTKSKIIEAGIVLFNYCILLLLLVVIKKMEIE